MFTCCSGIIVYNSLTKSVVALSFTEVEFCAAIVAAEITAAEIARYLQSMLTKLGSSLDGPTAIYEDNASTIMIVNAQGPTGRSRNIDIRVFTIQGLER